MQIEFFGQHLEDVILWKFFNKQKIGVYVDVGAHNGIVRSNTYLFEKLGWKGVCLEAHPLYAEQCYKNRPRSIVINAAVANANKDSVSFWATPGGGFSSLDRSMETYFAKAYKRHFTSYTEVKVPMVTLTKVLEENNIKHIDFISLDIEGSEINALVGLDWGKFRPRIVLSEALTAAHEKQLLQFMHSHGYFFGKKLGNNFFYCSDKISAETLARLKRGKTRKIFVK